MHRSAGVALLLGCSLTFGARAELRSSSVEDTDTYIRRAIKTFNVPGFAVAVVKDGKVLLARGYGVRRAGVAAPVDEHTLFFIGSTTKAFTAAALATLVDEGKLRWDEPIQTYLPWFKMYDPYASREITIRDLLAHRSGLGLGQGDLLFLPDTDLSAREIVERMQYLKPSSSFRSLHAYSNLGVMAAAQVIPELTGQTWEAYLRSKLFLPLGMSSTRTDAKGLTPADNIASSHDLVHGKIQSVDWPDIPATNSVGGIISNAIDLSKWIMVQLNHGRLPESDKRLFSEKQFREMWSGASFPTDWPPSTGPGMEIASSHFTEYGMGWYMYDYRGARIVEHSGGATQAAQIVLMPEQNAGFVLLSNSPLVTSEEIGAVMRYMMDSILGVPYVDWITKHKELLKSRLQADREMAQRSSAQRDAQSRPSLPLRAYTGTYHDSWYGDVSLSLENGRLVFRAAHSKRMVGDLEHWQHDTFVVRWRDNFVPDSYLYFALAPDAAIDNFKMKSVSALADFSFDFQDLCFMPVSTTPQK
jgi:CubicO group peptidase (beta-lactamase class C family)